MILDLVMIIATDQVGERVGNGQTRDIVVCTEKKKRTWRRIGDWRERAWISGGCVPLVHVSPISARTDGVGTGVWAGAAVGRRGGLAGWLVSSSRGLGKLREVEEGKESSPVSFPLHPPSHLPSPVSIPPSPHFADPTVFPMGSLAAHLVVCCMHVQIFHREQSTRE